MDVLDHEVPANRSDEPRLWRSILRGALGASLLFAAGSVGVPVPGVDRLLLGLTLATACWAASVIARRTSRPAALAAWLPLAFAGLVPASAAVLVPLALLPAALLARSRSRAVLRDEALLGIAFAALLQLSRVPLVQRELHELAYNLSRLLGLPGERGPELWLLVPWLSFPLYMIASPRSRGPRWLWKAGLLGLAVAAFLWQPHLAWTWLGLLPWSLLVGVSAAVAKPAELDLAPAAAAGVRALFLPAAAGTAALAVSLPFASLSAASVPGKKIAVVAGAGNLFELPPRDWKGGASGPEFALWLQRLRGAGIETSVVEGVPAAGDLAKLDALVFVNHADRLDEQRLAEVHAFVERGGGLLVLCDHTDMRGQIAPTDALLAPYGISLRNDSAVSLDPGGWWSGTIATSDHPAAGERFQGPDFGVSIGASLDVRAPAVPLLTARTGFGDAADLRRAGGLGDMLRSEADRFGITLAAVCESGAGRVVAFGDTSTFQDGALLSSLTFSDRIVAYLLCGARSQTPRQLATLLGLGVLLVCLARGRTTGAAARAAAGALVLLGTAPALGRDPEMRFETGSLAWIDLGHTGYAHVRDSGDHDVLAMARGFSRYGELARIAGPGELIGALASGGKRLVIPAPEAHYQPEELDALEAFLARGGEVWILARRLNYERSRDLFDRLGARISDEPLGSSTPIRLAGTTRELRPKEAWPVELAQGVALAGSDDRVFAAEKQVGAGRVVVVGDSEIFLGSQLERTWRVHWANAQLFRVLMGDPIEEIPVPPAVTHPQGEPRKRIAAAPVHGPAPAQLPPHAQPPAAGYAGRVDPEVEKLIEMQRRFQ